MSAARGRVLLAAAGVALLSYGLYGVVRHSAPPGVLIWAGGLLLAHDLVLAPVVAVVGWILTRLLPSWARPIVQGGLVVAAVVVITAVPVVLRQGAPGNFDSLLPLDYRANLIKVLAAVAVGTVLLVGVQAWRRVRTRRGGSRRRQPASS